MVRLQDLASATVARNAAEHRKRWRRPYLQHWRLFGCHGREAGVSRLSCPDRCYVRDTKGSKHGLLCSLSCPPCAASEAEGRVESSGGVDLGSIEHLGAQQLTVSGSYIPILPTRMRSQTDVNILCNCPKTHCLLQLTKRIDVRNC